MLEKDISGKMTDMINFLKRLTLFFILPLIFLSVVFVYYKKTEIKNYTINYLVNLIEEQTDCKVQLKNIHFSFPIKIYIDDLHLYKEEKCIASFNRSFVSLRPWELWNEGIAIHEIKIKEAILYECPTNSSNSSSLEWSLPSRSLSFKSVSIDKLIVEKKLIPESMQAVIEAPLSVQASFIFDPSKREAFLDLSASQKDKENVTQIALNLSALQEKIHVQIRISESEEGLFSLLYPFTKGYQWNLFSDVWTTLPVVESTFSRKMPLEKGELFQGEFQLNYLDTTTSNEWQSAFTDIGFFEGTILGDDQGLKIENLNGIAGKLNVQGAFALSYDMDISGSKLSFEMDDFYLTDKKLKVIHPRMQCIFIGKLPNPVIQLNGNCHEIQIAEYSLKNVIAQSACQHLDNAFNGNLFIEGEFLQTPCSFQTNFILKESLKLSMCQLTIDKAQMRGEMAIDIHTVLCEGEFQGDYSLLELQKRGMSEIEGDLSFHIYLNANENKQNVSLDFLVSNFKHQDCQASHIEIYATLIDIANMDFDRHKILLHAACKNGMYGLWNFENMELKTNTDSTTTEWPYSFACTLDKQGQLFSKGYWNASLGKCHLFVESFLGNFDKYQFALKNPFNLEYSDQGVTFSPLAIGIANGVIKVNGDFNHEELYLSLEAQQIPLELGNAFNRKIPVDGTLDCNIELVQKKGVTKGLAKVNVKGIDTLEEKLGIALPLEAQIEAKITPDFCFCRGLISGLSREPIPIALDVPISITLFPFQFEVKQQLPVSGNLSFKGAIEPIFELFIPANGPNISGQADLAINLSGTLEKPNVLGEANIYNGSVDIMGLGLSFREVQGHVTLTGKQATLVSLSGTDGRKGKVIAKGTVNIEPANHYPFDVGIVIEHALLRPSDYTWAIANGNFALSGNTNEAVINGKINTDEVHIQIPEQIPELLQTVEVTYVNQPENRLPPTVYKKKLSDWPLNLNLSLDIPQKGFVNGSSWTSEWNGHVVVTGTTDAPLAHGSCRLLKGDFKVQGKPFELKEGTITFAGDPEKKTSLYVIASEDLDEITAEIILKGPLRNPAISFRSNPPLPQREILSWILFNQGTSEITSFQGTQLNESITNLNMNDGKPDVLTKIRRGFGFDRLDISRDNNNPNEVSVQVGKYLSRGILVSVNKSVTADANQVALEADIAKNVKVKAQVGDDSEGQLQLKWKKDY